MRLRFIGVGVAVVLVASACSGGTNADEINDISDANESASSAPAADTDPVDAEEGDPFGVRATVTIGSDVTEIDGDVACLTGGAVAITFANETDQISINHSNDVILIRMTINGADWVDAGSPPAPVVVGEGGDAIVTWSGPMSSDGASETVSIEIHC